MNNRYFAPGEFKNMLLALAGQGVSLLGYKLYSFAIGLYVLNISNSAYSFAMTLCISTLPMVILCPIAGTLSDRISRKFLVVLSDALNGFLLLGAFVYSFYAPLTIEVVYIVTFLIAVFSSFLAPSLNSATRHLVHDGNVDMLISMRTALNSILQIASPALGGMVFLLVDIKVFLIVSALGFLLSALSELFIDFNFTKLSLIPTKKGFLDDFKAGYNYILNYKSLFMLMLISMIIYFFCSSIEVLLPLTLLKRLFLPERMYGLVMAAFSVSGILSAMYVSKKRVEFSKKLATNALIGFSIVFIAASIPLIFNFHSNFLVFAFYFVIVLAGGFVISTLSITIGVYMQKSIEHEFLGRVLGFMTSANWALQPIGYLIYGTLADFLNPIWLFYASAVGIFVAVVYFNGAKCIE